MAEVATAIVNPLGPLFSTTRAAGYLGVSVKHLRRLIATRKIRVLRDGREFGIYQAWADAFVAQHSIPTVAEQPEAEKPPTPRPIATMKEALKGIPRRFDVARPRRTARSVALPQEIAR